MSISTGNPQWICFISGIEVPIIGASTTVQEGQLAIAQVTSPYSPFLSKLPKHTKITLFSYDSSKDEEPLLEFDGTMQAVSWRQDKLQGNTGSFFTAQTDGMIWAEREKFNFYIENGFGVAPLRQTTKDFESAGAITSSPVTDPLAYILKSNNNDAGEVTSVFLTHRFDLNNQGIFDGTLTYTDCGWLTSKTYNTLEEVSNPNPTYYSAYLNKFYNNYQVTRKLCRIPIPKVWKDAFQIKFNWDLLTGHIQPLEGDVNFWNYVTYICDHFNFEIYDIPDCNLITLDQSEINYINGNTSVPGIQHSMFAEYIVKPKTPFGPIPYCNIIFPDQVLDKSFYKNFLVEVTRCWSLIWTFPIDPTIANAKLVHTGITGPYMPDDSDTYFGAFNVKLGLFNAETSPKQFLVRSQYEEEFGVNSKQIMIPELLARLLTTQTNTNQQAINNQKTLYNIVNAEFFAAYTDKVAFTMQVKPDVDIIPGMTILILDENDDHMLAYCYGREKIWDKNGEYVVNLKFRFPRHYTLQPGFANNYMNTFDPKYYADTYTQDLQILWKYIGCTTIDQNISIQNNIITTMKSWNESWNKNTPAMKAAQGSIYKRSRTTYSQFLNFYGVAGTKYDPTRTTNIMPEKLVDSWDLSSEDVAKMPALQYTYATDGYLDPQSTSTPNQIGNTFYPSYYKPPYDELNVPGPVIISPWIKGIINCHVRYLMQVGNYVS